MVDASHMVPCRGGLPHLACCAANFCMNAALHRAWGVGEGGHIGELGGAGQMCAVKASQQRACHTALLGRPAMPRPCQARATSNTPHHPAAQPPLDTHSCCTPSSGMEL